MTIVLVTNERGRRRRSPADRTLRIRDGRVEDGRRYSRRSASIGLRLTARHAG